MQRGCIDGRERMTTIIADRRTGVMVSDNQSTLENIKTPCRKVFRMTNGPNKGTLIGTSGERGPSLIFVEWYKTHGARDFSDDLSACSEDEEFLCILLTPKRKIFTVDRYFYIEEVEERYWAIGSGGDMVLGAMDAGATAVEALKIACKRDVNTSTMGRKLQVEKV